MVQKQINALKVANDTIRKAYVFGSYVNDPENANDVDVLLYCNSNDVKFNDMTGQISRVQYNCYKQLEKRSQDSKKIYDVVLVDNEKALNHFLAKNQSCIVEV